MFFCGLRVTELLTGYSRISSKTGEKITDIPLEETPHTVFHQRDVCSDS